MPIKSSIMWLLVNTTMWAQNVCYLFLFGYSTVTSFGNTSPSRRGPIQTNKHPQSRITLVPPFPAGFPIIRTHCFRIASRIIGRNRQASLCAPNKAAGTACGAIKLSTLTYRMSLRHSGQNAPEVTLKVPPKRNCSVSSLSLSRTLWVHQFGGNKIVIAFAVITVPLIQRRTGRVLQTGPLIHPRDLTPDVNQMTIDSSFPVDYPALSNRTPSTDPKKFDKPNKRG